MTDRQTYIHTDRQTEALYPNRLRGVCVCVCLGVFGGGGGGWSPVFTDMEPLVGDIKAAIKID